MVHVGYSHGRTEKNAQDSQRCEQNYIPSSLATYHVIDGEDSVDGGDLWRVVGVLYRGVCL